MFCSDSDICVAHTHTVSFRPYLQKIELDINDLSNYRPVTNLTLTHLPKIIERAMLDQLVPLLEEVGVVPHYQSAYRKFHSTEVALCKILDDLVRTLAMRRPLFWFFLICLLLLIQ